MINSAKIRAARALLGWQQKDLARHAGVSELSVVNLENNKTTPHKSTLEKIITTLTIYGIGFTERGVVEKNNTYTVIKGEKWYLRLIDDVEATLNALPEDQEKEWILIFPDERLSPPHVVERLQQIRYMKIKRRHFIKDGNNFIPSAFSEYRFVPEKYFDDDRLIHCYGDKVAILEQPRKVIADDGEKIIFSEGRQESQIFIFRSPELAALIRSMANMMWDVLPEPTETTATYFYKDP